MHLEAIRDGAGPDVDLLLDLNFNAKTEGYLKILRAIKDMDMFWVEIDTFNPQALGYIRRQSPHPISSCETLLGLREFLPYFSEQAMDVAIIDTPWNGVWQSMKIAAAAEHFEVNVAPHNFYGHLCTMMNAHFSAAVPNLRIMETDIDRLAWDHELFTHVPEIVDGHLDHAGPSRLGHRAQRGRPARPPAEGQGRAVELRAGGEEVGEPRRRHTLRMRAMTAVVVCGVRNVRFASPQFNIQPTQCIDPDAVAGVEQHRRGLGLDDRRARQCVVWLQVIERIDRHLAPTAEESLTRATRRARARRRRRLGDRNPAAPLRRPRRRGR